MKKDNKIKNSIKEIWDEINQELSNHSNELLLFDFTTVTHSTDNNLTIESHYFKSLMNYERRLKKYFKKYGYSIPPLNKNKPEPVLYSLNKYKTPKTSAAKYDSYGPETGENKTVHLETWHQFIEEKKMAGASWILFKDFFSDNDNERIEVGIYILLKNQVSDWNNYQEAKNDNERIPNTKKCEINSFLSSKVYTFLFDNGIDYIARAYKKRKDENLAIKNEERIKTMQHALQSAVAQVFARNFAHNIGSHVAIRATNKMAKERIAELYKINKANFKDNPAIEEWLDYMGEKLDLFEVARNEFLAEYKLPAKNAMLYRDVILPFCENTLLMDNIAHSEGIQYGKDGHDNKLKIKVKVNGVYICASYPQLVGFKNEKHITYPCRFPYLVKYTDSVKSLDDAFANKTLLGAEDIEICLTNEHTLYSILENLIRNSAKHNKDQLQSQDLIITINIEDEVGEDADNYYKVQIYDNISKVSKKQLNGFADSIKDSLITNDGEIQKKSLGIADIKINAHLLKTDADITNANLSKALTLVYQETGSKIFDKYKTEENPSEEKKYNFGYQFKLCKPKKVIWIGIKEDNNLKEKGIICIEDYMNFKPEGQAKTEEPLANYQFAILELDAVKDLTNVSPTYDWDDFLIKLPHRVLLNATSIDETNYPEIDKLIKTGRIQCVASIIPLPDTNDEDWDFTFLKTCWKNWLRKWVGFDEKARLIVYFENNQEKVDEWNNCHVNTEFLDVDFFSKSFLGRNIEVKDKYVIYDHHSEGYINILTKEGQEQHLINFINNGAYLQFSKSSIDFVDFFYPKANKYSNQLFLFQAFGAGQNKIVVVDERICEMLDVSDSNTQKVKNEYQYNSKLESDYADLANNGNVFIVTKFLDDTINSNCKNFEFCYNGEPILNQPGFLKIDEEKPIEFDALIIHRTYLIKLFEKNKIEAQKSIMHQLYRKFKRVVVVSGGGYPHSIEKFKISFKPYSQLKNCFIQYPSKIALSNLI